MIRLINRTTGTVMWVADSRLGEYLGRGHMLPPSPVDGKPEKATAQELDAVKKKTTTRKKTR